MHTRTTRPIMRTVQSGASLHDATVVLDDRVILRAVTLAFGPGLTLVRGPNGSGKTTLLRALAGLIPLARGDRKVSGDVLYIGHRPMLLRGLTALATTGARSSSRRTRTLSWTSTRGRRSRSTAARPQRRDRSDRPRRRARAPRRAKAARRRRRRRDFHRRARAP